jgi:hypothetical protein
VWDWLDFRPVGGSTDHGLNINPPEVTQHHSLRYGFSTDRATTLSDKRGRALAAIYDLSKARGASRRPRRLPRDPGSLPGSRPGARGGAPGCRPGARGAPKGATQGFPVLSGGAGEGLPQALGKPCIGGFIFMESSARILTLRLGVQSDGRVPPVFVLLFHQFPQELRQTCGGTASKLASAR